MTAISATIFNPRRFPSTSCSCNLCALSRTPIWKPTPWILERGATGLCKPNLDIFAKLFENPLERRLEAQAFSRREIGGYDDVLDFFVGQSIDVDVARQPARGSRPARPSALVTAGQIAPEVLALAGGALDEGVDGLEPQGAQTALVAGLEPSGNLFGRPSFRKTIADESPQSLIFFEDGFTPPAQLIGSGGVKRRITPAREGVASQFPRDGGFCSLKRPGDGADRAAGPLHGRDYSSERIYAAM